MSNKHGTHRATCYCCKHLYLDDGCLGYSDMTPGYDASIICMKNRFDVDAIEIGNAIHTIMTKARDCPDFGGRKHD